MASRITEPNIKQFPQMWQRCFFATRPAFLNAAFLAWALGTVAAWDRGINFDPVVAGACLFLALFAQAGTNVINDYYDALNKTDEYNQNHIYPFTGGSRFIQNELLTIEQTFTLALSLFIPVIVIGIILCLLLGDLRLILFGVTGLLLGWFYSATPFKLNARGFGEIVVFLSFVLIVMGSNYVHTQHFDLEAWLIGVPYGLIAMNLLLINQFPDYEADKHAGKCNLVVRFGKNRACWFYLMANIVAYSWLMIMVLTGQLHLACSIALFAIVPSWRASYELMRHHQVPRRLRRAIELSILALSSYGILMTGSIIYGKLITLGYLP